MFYTTSTTDVPYSPPKTGGIHGKKALRANADAGRAAKFAIHNCNNINSNRWTVLEVAVPPPFFVHRKIHSECEEIEEFCESIALLMG